MSKINVTLDSIQVTEGQGVAEGAFEISMQVLEVVSHPHSSTDILKVIWPDLGTTEKVKKDGTVKHIGRLIETYTVTGSASKSYRILVTEEDTGTLGQDEEGNVVIDFELTDNMPKTKKSGSVTLENKAGNEGKVKVTLVAEKVS